MANLTDEQRKEYLKLFKERKYLLAWLKDKEKDPDQNLAGEVEKKQVRLAEVRKRIRELKPLTEKQIAAYERWKATGRDALERARQRKKEKQKEIDGGTIQTGPIKANAPDNPEKGKKVIEDIVKKTADEHKKEIRVAPKKDSEVKKTQAPEKRNSWVWVILIVGIVSALIGAYFIVKKYAREIKSEQPRGNGGSPESSEDGFWWLPRG